MTFCESELENFDWKPKIQSIISKGNVHGTITEVVEVKNVDIIVMGTRTHSAAKQFFMGSIVNKVMRNSDVPVMVVCTKSALSFK
jgi:nucleotide-binding universal stress UspA family protein